MVVLAVGGTEKKTQIHWLLAVCWKFKPSKLIECAYNYLIVAIVHLFVSYCDI